MVAPSPRDKQSVNATANVVPQLEVEAISKRFPGVLALDEVSLRIMPGETLAVIGENGAGKSTLMKILAGIERPNQGQLKLAGREIEFHQPADAIAAGVSLIHQELNLHEQLSIAENIFLGREPNRFGWLDRAEMVRQAATYLQRVGLNMNPQASLSSLSTAGRQLVEVAKALSVGASVLIMDEPTSSLTNRETEILFEVVARLQTEGVSVVYISHRLGEVVQIADRVEVLRDGRNAGELRGAEINHDRMVAAMVGRDVKQLYQRHTQPAGETVLTVSGLKVTPSQTKPIDLSLRHGEVVGIAGLVGSGRSELLETLFGVRSPACGDVVVDSHRLKPGSVRDAIRAGLALVPEDRKRTGLLIESSVRQNATLAALGDAPLAPWLDPRWQQSTTARLIEQLRVKTSSQLTAIANLSGGNQQKIAVGKWLVREPLVLMLDEPTRGVDVGAKQEIYALLDALAAAGIAILFVSSELDEVLALADRVLVMHEGTVAGELSGAELTEQAVMRLAVGLTTVPS